MRDEHYIKILDDTRTRELLFVEDKLVSIDSLMNGCSHTIIIKFCVDKTKTEDYKKSIKALKNKNLTVGIYVDIYDVYEIYENFKLKNYRIKKGTYSFDKCSIELIKLNI